jgi:acetoin utilization protein AcuB
MEHQSGDRFMTHGPITIERAESISSARRLMQTHCIRHLPVLHGGKLVGLVSQRDLERFDKAIDLDQRLVPVGEAMSSPAYSVLSDASLREVAAQMSSRRCGAAVVIDEQQHVVGLITAVDGLRALSCLLDPAPFPEPAADAMAESCRPSAAADPTSTPPGGADVACEWSAAQRLHALGNGRHGPPS